MSTLWDVIKHINEKIPLEFTDGDYSPWMVNRVFSNTIDTLFFAEVMNRATHLDKDIQHDFYYYALPKARRFGKYHKAETINIYVELMMNLYQVNQRVAESYVKCMSEATLKQLKEQMVEGGKK